MNCSILIATYGDQAWEDLAWSRAWPSARDQEPAELLCFHDPEGTIASVRDELGSTAKGDWLCFLDADDELAPGFLDAMARAFEQERLDGDLLLTPSRNHRGVFGPEKPISEGNWLCIGTLVPRRLFIEVGGFPDYPYGWEDWALWVKCVQAGARIVKVPDALYRAHRSRRLHKERWRQDPRWQSETHARIAAELGI